MSPLVDNYYVAEGRFHQDMRVAFSSAQDEIFGEQHNDLAKVWGRRLVKLNGDTSLYAVRRRLFAWRTKVGEINPECHTKKQVDKNVS